MPRTINFEPHFDAITSKYGKELDADMVKEYVANNPDVLIRQLPSISTNGKSVEVNGTSKHPSKRLRFQLLHFKYSNHNQLNSQRLRKLNKILSLQRITHSYLSATSLHSRK